MVKLPTVAIALNGGPVVINQSDYDPEQHTLWDDSPHPPKTAAASPQPEPEPEQPGADAQAQAGGLGPGPIQQLADELSRQYTKPELYDMATERNIRGRSKMSEPELAYAIATAQFVDSTGSPQEEQG